MCLGMFKGIKSSVKVTVHSFAFSQRNKVNFTKRKCFMLILSGGQIFGM